MAAGIYLHMPFCRSRCSYCDFATDIYRDARGVQRYIEALCKEISAFQQGFTQSDTIYFGGGTPSLLSAAQVESILKITRSKFDISSNAEITMEMNPATVTPETLTAYRSIEVNRASFGVQTFNDRALKLLARGHDSDDARQTFKWLREAGFDNISFDLIAGLPGQTFADWRRNLAEAVELNPEHLSLYLLEIHEGTPLAEQVRSGRQPLPDDDLAAEMYEYMIDTLANAGYRQYEISNFSRPGFESAYNNKYWRLDPVFGFGVSAHSFDGHQRYANEGDTAKYVELLESGNTCEVMRENIDLMSEFAFLGLRLDDGVYLDKYQKLFGVDLLEKYCAEINDLIAAELITVIDSQMQLTRKGKLYSNEVFSVFV